MKALAVDLGGSHAACAVVDEREVLARETVSLEAARGLAGALPVDRGGAQARVGLGRGRRRRLRRPRLRLLRPRRPVARARPLDEREVRRRPRARPAAAGAVRRFGLPFRIENDARLALLGERHGGRRARVRRRGDDDARHRHRRRRDDRGPPPAREALPGRRPRRSPRGRLRGPALHLRRRRLRRGRGLDLGAARDRRETAGFETSALARAPRLDFEALFARRGDGRRRGRRGARPLPPRLGGGRRGDGPRVGPGGAGGRRRRDEARRGGAAGDRGARPPRTRGRRGER